MSERKPEDLKSLAQQVLAAAQDRGVMLAAAESCTGGLLSAALTDIPGCSGALDRAFVTYSNEAKVQMLGVSQQALDDHGAVSPQVAAQMASGALERSGVRGLEKVLAGPSTVLFGGRDVVELSKEIVEAAKKNDKIQIKGGSVEGSTLDPAGVETLSKSPRTSSAEAGRGFAFPPPRTAAASASAGRSSRGMPRWRRRVKPESRASSSARPIGSCVRIASPKRSISAAATSMLKRSAGGRQIAFAAPCAMP